MADVIVIGGGPAGSAAASFLARAGIDVALLEGDIHPRPHVGESLVTSTTRIFDELGFLPVMEREGFVKKYGAAWHGFTRRQEFGIEFREFPQEGIHQDYTYHVDRARFDSLLLRHAHTLGARVYQGVRVQEVIFEGDRAVGVRAEVEGQPLTLKADLIIDASGRRAIIGRQLKILEKDPIFDQFAVHAWFEDVDRSQHKTEDFIHIYFLQAKRGWGWQIPITDKITSIGVVTEREVFKDVKDDVEGWFRARIASNPDFQRAMEPARRVNEFKKEGDYSYCMSKFAGPGWVLVGDAARFVDPIFSSGVSVALYGAKFATEVVKSAWEREKSVRNADFSSYEHRLRHGVTVWYDFIRLYYKLLPMFTHFIQGEHRMEVLRLLQGEVYDRSEVKVLDAMRAFIRSVESSEDHLLRGALSDVPID